MQPLVLSLKIGKHFRRIKLQEDDLNTSLFHTHHLVFLSTFVDVDLRHRFSAVSPRLYNELRPSFILVRLLTDDQVFSLSSSS